MKKITGIMLPLIAILALSFSAFASPADNRGTTAGNMQNGGYAAASGEWIYFYSDGSLYRTRTGGDDIRVLVRDIDSTLSDRFGGKINIIDNWIYFATLHGSIYKVSIEGGTPQLFLAGNDRPWIGVCEFLYADDWIYYNYETPTYGTLNRSSIIYRMRPDGSGKKALIGQDNGDMYWLLDVAGGYVYYTGIRHEEEKFYNYRMPVEGGEPERLDFMPYAAQIQVEDGWIYFCDSGDTQTVRRIRTDGSDEEILYKQGFCNNINVAGDWIYFLARETKEDYNHTSYMRMKTDGSNIQLLNQEKTYASAVAGDVVCSMVGEAMRLRGEEAAPYLKRISVN